MKKINKKIVIAVLIVACLANMIGFIVEMSVSNGIINTWSSLCLSFSVIFFIFIWLYVAILKVTKYDDKVDQVKPCRYCNAPNDKDAKYCKICGKPFDDNEIDPDSSFGGKNYL